jgi:hypothetical protein
VRLHIIQKLNNMYIELHNIPNENNMYLHRLFILFDLYFNRVKIQQKAAGRKKTDLCDKRGQVRDCILF